MLVIFPTQNWNPTKGFVLFLCYRIVPSALKFKVAKKAMIIVKNTDYKKQQHSRESTGAGSILTALKPSNNVKKSLCVSKGWENWFFRRSCSKQAQYEGHGGNVVVHKMNV